MRASQVNYCPHFAEWLKRLPERTTEFPEIRIDFSVEPKEIVRTIIAEPEGHLSIQSHFNPSYGPTEFRIKSSAQWFFESSDTVDIRAALSVARDCQNFLTLVLGIPSEIIRISVQGQSSGLPATLEASPDSGRGAWAELITSLARSNRNRQSHRLDPVLRFNQLGSEAPKILQSWFQLQAKLREVVAVMLACRYVQSYTTTEFLNLTQALESFHRRIFGGTYYSPQDYKTIQDALVKAIPSHLEAGFRQKLKSTYEYANEYSLRKRLQHLCSLLSPNTAGWIGQDVNAFIEKIVRTRNYLTHLGEKDKSGSLLPDEDSLSELWQANRKLMALATIHLFIQAGIPEQSVAARVFRLP